MLLPDGDLAAHLAFQLQPRAMLPAVRVEIARSEHQIPDRSGRQEVSRRLLRCDAQVRRPGDDATVAQVLDDGRVAVAGGGRQREDDLEAARDLAPS